jgi:DNA-binding NarL/FixJ family response regulator
MIENSGLLTSRRKAYLAFTEYNKKKRILIIDRDPIFANTLKRFLEQEDFEVFFSETGCNGIFNVIVKKPDVVISEMDLPDIPGITIQKELNKIKPVVNTRFIYLSKCFSGYLKREAFDQGAERYLLKNSSFEEILDVIKSKPDKLQRVSPINLELFNNSISSDENLNEPENEEYVQIITENSSHEYEQVHSLLKTVQNKNLIQKDEFQAETNNVLSEEAFPVPLDKLGLKDYEKFYFQNVTLIVVNMTRATQKEAEGFRDFIFPTVSQKPQLLLMDLTQLEYIDSAFMGVIIDASKSLKKFGGTEVNIVFDCDCSTINPFIMEWMKRNFKIYEDLNYAMSCLNE